jgi:hypothetical protein
MRSVVVLGFTVKTGNIAQVKSGGKVNVNYIGFTTERRGRGNTAAKVRCAKFGKLCCVQFELQVVAGRFGC